MTLYKISGRAGNYSIFFRNTEATYPNLFSLHGGTVRNAKRWKTERGAMNYARKNFPEWVQEVKTIPV